MKTLLAAIALLMSIQVNAGDVRVGNFMWSKHWLEQSQHTNEDHSASFYGCYTEWCGGWFEHSFDDTAHLLFYDFDIYKTDWVEIDLPAGGVEGYQGYSTDEKILPWVALTATFPVIRTDQIKAGVRVWQVGKEVTAIGFELRIK
jgi:hypothetical protein